MLTLRNKQKPQTASCCYYVSWISFYKVDFICLPVKISSSFQQRYFVCNSKTYPTVYKNKINKSCLYNSKLTFFLAIKSVLYYK